QNEVEKMRHEAESHADEDKKRRELIDVRNQADGMIYQIEKLLKEHAAKITDADRAPIQAAVEKLKQVASKDDPAAIRQALEELQQASFAMSKHMYGEGGPGAAGAGPGAGPQGAQPSGDGKDKDTVIDAEFEEKK